MLNTSSSAQRPEIWAIASGKGGVGKSFISANLGLALAEHHKKVVLVDLDLGGANIHTCLGVTNPKTTLSDLLNPHNDDINSLIVYNGNPNIGLISGAADNLQMANLKHFQKLKIMRKLSHIDADFVILDLGAGTSFNTLDFFLHADHAILAVTPEPTSVENSYRFIKCLLARKLKSLPEETRKNMHHVLVQGKANNGKPQSFSTFLSEMSLQYPEHEHIIRETLKELDLNLIINQAIDNADAKLSVSMAIIFRKYFDIQLNILGHLYHDMHVIHALRQKNAYYHSFPQSRNAISLNSIAKLLISKQVEEHKVAMDVSL